MLDLIYLIIISSVLSARLEEFGKGLQSSLSAVVNHLNNIHSQHVQNVTKETYD